MTKCGVSIFVGILLLIAIPSGRAASTLHAITPGHLEDGGFAFDITEKRNSDGTIHFCVLVIEKERTFTHPTAALSIVKITRTPTETSDEIKTIRTLPQERKDKSSGCVFVVERKTLEDPNFCFVFTNPSEEVINGKVVSMPSADFFFVRLKDYINE